jgi:formimidoylglutamate deiminase
MTLLPVLYMAGGFDGRPLAERQRRFGHEVDAFLALVETLRADEDASLRVGCALHSLRAVPADAMHAVLAALPRDVPMHIHIAEQLGEVQDSLALRGARPVEWLLDNAEVDARWTLVHATHLEPAEVQGIARSGATVAICPTTEANLGDGLFPLRAFLDAGGAIGVGSDSQVSVSPVEELRWLEYGQRLATRRRNIAARVLDASVGEVLWGAALQGGRRAAGIADDDGAGADFIVLDDTSPLLAARDERSAIDAFLFAGNAPLVRNVMADGEWVVRDFHHRDEVRIAARYRETVEALATG